MMIRRWCRRTAVNEATQHLATELVFMLVLRRFWIHQSIRLITWGAAALTCVSLTVFVVAGQPGGGQPTGNDKEAAGRPASGRLSPRRDGRDGHGA